MGLPQIFGFDLPALAHHRSASLLLSAYEEFISLDSNVEATDAQREYGISTKEYVRARAEAMFPSNTFSMCLEVSRRLTCFPHVRCRAGAN